MLGPDLLMELEQLVTKVQVNLKESSQIELLSLRENFGEIYFSDYKCS